MPANVEEYFASFPDDVPTAPLVTISLEKLVLDDSTEKQRLFGASKELGFFYLDLRGCQEGEALLGQSDKMFDLMEEFYSLPLEEKLKYDFAAAGSYFGYKGMGAEVIDGKGTRDSNEIYNVCLHKCRLGFADEVRFQKTTCFQSATRLLRQSLSWRIAPAWLNTSVRTTAS